MTTATAALARRAAKHGLRIGALPFLSTNGVGIEHSYQLIVATTNRIVAGEFDQLTLEDIHQELLKWETPQPAPTWLRKTWPTDAEMEEQDRADEERARQEKAEAVRLEAESKLERSVKLHARDLGLYLRPRRKGDVTERFLIASGPNAGYRTAWLICKFSDNYPAAGEDSLMDLDAVEAWLTGYEEEHSNGTT